MPDATDGAVVNATVQAKHAAHRQHVAAWKIRRFKRLLSEIARREREPLRLYEPLKALVPFHSCRAQERILIGSNRGGKTTGAIMEFVKIITGQHDDPTYPKTNGRAYIVVKDERQIGQVIYRKLFRAGAIRIIRDEETKKWRSYRPLTDSHRKHESKPAPPLIPLRLLKGGRKGISFRLKKDNIFKQFTLTNGWEVLAMPAGGDPPRGTDIHLALFDENVPQSWYDEVTARLMEHHGKLIWSATPQDEDCEALANLADRADQMAGDENPPVVRFDLKLDANVFMEQESKEEFKKKFANDPEQYRIRIEGEFASLGLLVYPEFHLIRHGIKQEKLPKACIPDTWTRYCALDPGNRVCAVAFVAVPPPDLGDHVYLYDELYIRDADADKLGKQMAEKCKGQHFHAIVIDDHGSRRSEFGGKTLKDQARESFDKYKVWDHFTQPYFVPGSDDVEGRVAEFRSWLRGDDPKFVCVEDTTPNCQKEFRRYHRQRIKGVVQDKPDPRSPWGHLMDCYDAETEVLTRDGWRKFDVLTGHEELATVNLDTDQIEYQVPTQLIKRWHEGDMIQFGGHKLNACVTPTHRMVTVDKHGKTVVRTAESLVPSNRIKLHAKWTGKDVQTVKILGDYRCGKDVMVDAGDFAEFLGWYVAEGCCATKIKIPGAGYRVTISQKKQDGREQLERLFAKLPWNVVPNGHNYEFSSKQLWQQVCHLGNKYTKRVPQWIKEASPRIIKRFLDGAIAGDGNRSRHQTFYYTVSPALADDMQELFIKSGTTASVRLRKAQAYCINGRSGTTTRDQYHLTEWTKSVGVLRDSSGAPNYKRIPYAGYVYCASVPNTTLIVRRHGRPMICGNCLGYIAHYRGLRYRRPIKPKTKAKETTIDAYIARMERRERRLNGHTNHIPLSA